MSTKETRVVGRYALFGQIASGGMATVHLGRLVGPVGFSKLVAIKKLHPQFAKDPDFVSMFLDEARLASRIQHPNVVSTLDVVTVDEEVLLVMEYVQGESLSKLIRNALAEGERMPVGHAVAALAGMLQGLHAAHEALSERREPLNIVHRDISPQNVLVGVDGVARVLDFGVAKAAMRSSSTRDGVAKGKLSYMSPEQLNGKPVDRRTDIFAAGIVLWETLCAQRLFAGADAGEVFGKVVAAPIPEPQSVVGEISETLNRVVMRALERDPEKRFQTANDFAIALESAASLSSTRVIGEWVRRVGGEAIRERELMIAEAESASTDVGNLRLQRRGNSGVVPALPPRVSETSRFQVVRATPSDHAELGPESGSQPSVRSAVRETGPLRASAPSIEASPAPSFPPLRPRRRVTAWLALAGLAGGGLAFLVMRGVTSEAPAPAAAGKASAWTGASAATLEKVPTLSVEDLPVAPGESEEEAIEVLDLDAIDTPPAVSAMPPAIPTPKVEVQRPVRVSPKPIVQQKPVPKPQASAKEPATNCNPPWLLDENGVRRLKPECL